MEFLFPKIFILDFMVTFITMFLIITLPVYLVVFLSTSLSLRKALTKFFCNKIRTGVVVFGALVNTMTYFKSKLPLYFHDLFDNDIFVTAFTGYAIGTLISDIRDNAN